MTGSRWWKYEYLASNLAGSGLILLFLSKLTAHLLEELLLSSGCPFCLTFAEQILSRPSGYYC